MFVSIFRFLFGHDWPIDYFSIFNVSERDGNLSNFACLQLRLKEGEDISGTLVIFQSLTVLTRQIETLTEILVRLGLGQINRVERFVSAVI